MTLNYYTIVLLNGESPLTHKTEFVTDKSTDNIMPSSVPKNSI